REQLPRGVTERAIRRREELEPAVHFGERRAVDQQDRRANSGNVPQRLRNRCVGRDHVIQRDRRLGVALAELGRLLQTRQRAVAGRAVGRDLGERSLRLGRFAVGVGQLDRGVELGAGLGRLLGLPVLPAAIGSDTGDEQNGERNQIVAIALPQLLELFSPYFLV